MNPYAPYFAAGYVPALASTYFNQLAFASQYLDNPDDGLRVFADSEFDRIQDSPQSERAQQNILRAVSIADTLRVNVPAIPDEPSPSAFFPWLHAYVGALKTHVAGLPDKAGSYAYAAGATAAEIICTLNQIAYLVRFLIAGYSPELEMQWDALNMSLQQAIPKLLQAAAHGELPPPIREMGLPFSNVINDLMLFPKRSDDKPYLVLLGRNLQSEVFNLLDLVEQIDESLGGSIL